MPTMKNVLLLGDSIRQMYQPYVQVELAENVRVKVVSSTLSDVLNKGAPVAGSSANDDDKDGGGDNSGGNGPAPEKKSLFSFGSKK